MVAGSSTPPRRQKNWIKWTLFSIATVLILLFSYGGYVYYQIASIDIEDIEQRVEQHEQGVEPSETPEPLPGIVEKTVDIANGFASKPIDSQDALDVASILLNSGLSFKDVYYLMGKSTEQLSNEEKQEIRDKLLAKLTPEEIKALRAITQEYGKGLVILDPNYPIELVGVYDEAERQRIKKELEEKKGKQATAASASPLASAAPVRQAGGQPVSSSPAPTPAQASSSNSEGKRSIEAKYEGQLSQLQASCSAEASGLASQIAAKLKSDKQAGKSLSVAELESQYMQQIVQAEGRCNSQFNSIVGQAKQELNNAGFATDVIAGWSQRYEAAKESVRSKAIATMSAAVK
jgi:hypothetical protein